jgi:hypothetical protein
MDLAFGAHEACTFGVQDSNYEDSNNAREESKAAQNLSSLCDVHTLLAYLCVIPLLESVDSLIKFA